MRRNSKTSLSFAFGVLGEWERPYLTLRPELKFKQLGIFGEMAKRGHIYKGLKNCILVYALRNCIGRGRNRIR